MCNNILTPMAPLLCIRLRQGLLLAARFLQVQQRLTKTPRQQKTNRNQTTWATPCSTDYKCETCSWCWNVMFITCTFFRFVSFREPHRYSNLLCMQESPSNINLIGPNTSHVIHGNLFCTSTFVESLKETNKIETKQQKSKSKNKTIEKQKQKQYFRLV